MSDSDDPRMFFAVERTPLAWSRTSMTFMGCGFLMEHFSMFVKMSLGMPDKRLLKSRASWLGLIFVVCGILVALFSSIQCGRFGKTLKVDKIHENCRTSVVILSGMLLVASGVFFSIPVSHAY